MGIFDKILNRNTESNLKVELDEFQEKSNNTYMKKLAIETCISFLGRTISQTEFRVKERDKHVKDDLYYRLNVRPNKNQTASTFWQKFVHKLVYDNEVLIIQAADEDLLIADEFEHIENATSEDNFTNVIVKDFEFRQVFKQSEVIHLKYNNEKLSSLIDSLFADYGDLFGRILSSQKRKNQIRATVDVDLNLAKTKEPTEQLQTFINNLYGAINTKDVAIIPQQPGYKYSETSSNGTVGQSVDEINKVMNGFLDQVAMAIGIPVSLLRGDMADVEKQTKNYMTFTVSPLLLKIKNEGDAKFFTQKEHLDGNYIDVRKPSYRDIFDLATAIDKLKASGFANGNELRDEVGWDRVDDPIMDAYFITKNYQESSEALKGGDNE